MATIDVKCICGTTFKARVADRKRGWGRFCSKRCKAVEQEHRTGQHKAHMKRVRKARRRESDGTFQMSIGDLAMGGYGDADYNTPFGEGKW